MIKLIQLKSGLMDTLGDVYCIEIDRHVDDTFVFFICKKKGSLHSALPVYGIIPATTKCHDVLSKGSPL